MSKLLLTIVDLSCNQRCRNCHLLLTAVRQFSSCVLVSYGKVSRHIGEMELIFSMQQFKVKFILVVS